MSPKVTSKDEEESKSASEMTLTTKEFKEAIKSRDKIPKFYFPEGWPIEDEK